MNCLECFSGHTIVCTGTFWTRLQPNFFSFCWCLLSAVRCSASELVIRSTSLTQKHFPFISKIYENFRSMIYWKTVNKQNMIFIKNPGTAVPIYPHKLGRAAQGNTTNDTITCVQKGYGYLKYSQLHKPWRFCDTENVKKFAHWNQHNIWWWLKCESEMSLT